MSEIQPRCYQCGEVFTKRLAQPHHRKLRYEGTSHDVLVSDMPEWHCEACDLSVTDEEGDEPLQAALRNHVGLLTPQQIKAGIKALGMTQEKFAEKIRCAPESISRWLNGAVLQSRVYDCLMRIYFQFPQVRGALDQFSPASSFGDTVVHACEGSTKTCGRAGWRDSDSRVAMSMQAYDSYREATLVVLSPVSSGVRSTADESFAGRSGLQAAIMKKLYWQYEPVESRSHSIANRISNFFPVDFGGGA